MEQNMNKTYPRSLKILKHSYLKIPQWSGHNISKIIILKVLKSPGWGSLKNLQMFVSLALDLEKHPKVVHPGKLTCPLKTDYFNRKYIFQPSIFRGHVSFRECSYFKWTCGPLHQMKLVGVIYSIFMWNYWKEIDTPIHPRKWTNVKGTHFKRKVHYCSGKWNL